MVSVIVLPAMSVPVTVNVVEDKSPLADVIEIVPLSDEWEVGVPREVPDVIDAPE